MKCQPSKWIWGLLPLALPFFGAWIFNSGALQTEVKDDATAALKSGGFDWAQLNADGRDLSLSGEASSQEAIDQAVKVVAGTYGVRRVDSSGVLVAKPVVLDVPTIAPYSGNETSPQLSGTWPEGTASQLTVSLADKDYVLGKDDALKSDGQGNWTLKPDSELAVGTYDAKVTVGDGKDASATDTSKDEIVIVAPEMKVPPVAAVFSPTQVNAKELSGTWPEAAGSQLQVSLADKDYKLGEAKELTSDGSGNWKLAVGEGLADGNYDATALVTNAEGLTSNATLKDALKIDRTAPSAPMVHKIISNNTKPAITGTWPEKEASKLTVKFGNQSYVLGTDQALTSDGAGNWTLMPATDIADGVYNVVAQAGDDAGNSVHDDSDSEVVIDTHAPAEPTISTVMTRSTKPEVTGGWQADDAEKLDVTVAGKTYSLGKDPELTTNGDVWSFQPKTDLSDGTYDVAVTVTDKAGNSTSDSTKDELVIDSTPPSKPTVTSYSGEKSPEMVSGTWPKSDADTLSVTLNNKAYTLGVDSELTSDDSGKWMLKGAELPAGTYDVAVTVADKAGQQSSDTSKDEIVITTPASAETMDCQAAFNDTMAGQVIGFDVAKASIKSSSMDLIGKLVVIAQKCPSAKIEIGGHTDSAGSENYNQALSERRASNVVKAMIAAGVAPKRLKAIGYGESKPVASNETEAGMAKNRRIEFVVVQ